MVIQEGNKVAKEIVVLELPEQMQMVIARGNNLLVQDAVTNIIRGIYNLAAIKLYDDDILTYTANIQELVAGTCIFFPEDASILTEYYMAVEEMVNEVIEMIVGMGLKLIKYEIKSLGNNKYTVEYGM